MSSEARPVVAVNFALTWDARITTRERTPVDFSSRADKRRLHEIRAGADAIMVGRKTLEADETRLGLPDDLRDARVARGERAWPLRVIVTGSGAIAPSDRIFQRTELPVIIYSRNKCDAPGEVRALTGLAEMLRDLRARDGVRRLVCEGGGELFRALVEAELVDEINLTLCPHVFGGEGAPTLTGVADGFLPRAAELRLAKMEVVGDECFLRYHVVR